MTKEEEKGRLRTRKMRMQEKGERKKKKKEEEKKTLFPLFKQTSTHTYTKGDNKR